MSIVLLCCSDATKLARMMLDMLLSTLYLSIFLSVTLGILPGFKSSYVQEIFNRIKLN